MEYLRNFMKDNVLSHPSHENLYIDIMEVEFYKDGDPYKHMNERQKKSKSFYVHRSGKLESSSYKAGTYKGIDYVDTENISILIRSVRIIDNSSTIIEGPCKVVDFLCQTFGVTLSELENTLQLRTTADLPLNISVMRFHHNIANYGARVGLTLKRCPNLPCRKDSIPNDTMEWLKYLSAPLRAARYLPSKHRNLFYIGNILCKPQNLPVKIDSILTEISNARNSSEINSTHTAIMCGIHLGWIQ